MRIVFGWSLEAKVAFYVERDEDAAACWTWKGRINRAGYGTVKHGGKSFLGHRMVWEFANGPIPSGLFICHRCDNRSCCNPRHLYAGTHEDNMRDMKSRGRSRCARLLGNANPAARLTEKQVRAIRRETGMHAVVAHKYGVNETTIGCIRRRKTWRHI